MSTPWPSSDAPAEQGRSGASTPEDLAQPRTPLTSTFESPLLSPDSREPRTPNRASSAGANFVSSPLNPNSTLNARSRPASRGSTYFNRIASEESQALAGPYGTLGGQRGSMVLYRLASDDNSESLAPPTALQNRDSVISSSGDSVFSLSSDSKYPSGMVIGTRGFVPYAYDPEVDKDAPDDDDDFLHTPEYGHNRHSYWSSRGIMNVGVLVILVAAILTLFLCYPLLDFFRNESRNVAITANVRINATGQAPVLFDMPELIDPDTPDSAKTRTGFDGEAYELVFSDEFNKDNRTFYPGDDPFWEAADLWYGSTADLEWYDPKQVYTKNGALQIVMEQVADPSINHNQSYISGMLQSWNKFCFTSGYIEVSMTLPGPDSNTQGYWPGAWTMGNLGRPGYRATTDGTWPYSYDSCDVGTFPNQTLADGSGPAAALHSDQSRSKYNNELSWLPGQRVSACTCPGEEHPGPSNNVGRGVPEIDILEAEKNKTDGGVGQVVSQSAQFAPFTHDYLYTNDTQDAWWIYDSSRSRANTYKGSAIQQAVSALTDLPDDMFQGSGANFKTLGFEYWANPKNRDEGFITWQTDGTPSVRMGASAMGPDMGTDGSQVSQRIVPEEPMSIILNLGLSKNWQDILLETMVFPAIMQIDYVRVYQRSDSINVGCDPAGYPTADYINNHLEAYSNVNLTYWSQPSPSGAGYPWPKNSALAGGC
ncbi:beta-glucan synthesis-associated [Trametes versicolor FP-101664 SS1]|uniref:beta-glucan synthesis-associated n=1 Tax=Trametes versicolor (strain FP-101664) TaxID=717944 RepID=UPI0004621FEE|nr:beta-glucan synthesis-associated [Trametes versicolor FP-101664 SS1]EIW55856.1 beta-glucan synthesis-associated [Trametes versicolor FP-101664 SS1]